MPSMNGKGPVRGKQYWRSLNDLADKPEFREFVQREFPHHASEWLETEGNGESRRTFLKVMGASMALAGLAGCIRWPDEKLAPYAHRPANRMDGEPVHYATAYELGGMGIGVLAVSFDGRPIKVDGNPTHPMTRGGSDAYLQASVLNVYDPDRSRDVLMTPGAGRKKSTWEAFASAVKPVVGANGAGLVVLAEASRSPSMAAMRRRLPEAKWFEYEVISNDNQRAGAMQFAGRPLRAVPVLDQAQIIVSIDADLFYGEPLAIKFNRDFSAGRKVRDNAKAAEAAMSRLYMIESGFSTTGSMADHRRAVKPSEIPMVVGLIAASLGAGGVADLNAVPQELQNFVAALVKDIKAGRRTAFVAGHAQPPEVHAAVAALNAQLGAPVDYYAEPEDPRAEQGWAPHSEQIKAFVQAVPGAAAVLVLGANPVLSAPADLKIADVLKVAKFSVHAGTHEDETAQVCQWHLPLTHYLEAWGDVRTVDGTVSVTQPLIMPLFGAKSSVEILAMLAGQEAAGYDIVRATARDGYMKGTFSDWSWKKALFDGVVTNTAWTPVAVAKNAERSTAVMGTLGKGAKGEGYEVALTVGAVHDGRFANNGWLQELPDPMTRVSWLNPVVISPATARKLGVQSDDVIEISTSAGKIEATVYEMPGMADGTLSIARGYGRKGVGAIADDIGSNAYALRTTADGAYVGNVNVRVTGERKEVASVQDHHTIDDVGKTRLHTLVPELVVEGTLEQYKKRPAIGTRKVIALSMFNEFTYEPGKKWVQAKWGMAIDLSTCTGCSACVVACQAENNIPVVGKEMVYRGREMHWLRIDRYFKWGHEGKVVDEKGTPQVVHQPVMCVHCENAPCEEVCPVAATTHSHEGLNMMTYNRCIGTRYCSNNCPYKVRRFNFFDYNSGQTQGAGADLYTPNLLRSDLNELVKMQKNPQVTVRSRGVMEKCTYCVQRIEAARITLRANNRTKADEMMFEDGAVRTACQQACPTDTIVFGDLNQDGRNGRPLSRVAAMHAAAQSYGLLDPELNTKPRTQYLAKIRNPTEGLDKELYNEHTASEGFFWEENSKVELKGAGAGHEAHAPGGPPLAQ